MSVVGARIFSFIKRPFKILMESEIPQSAKKTRICNPRINLIYFLADFCKNPNPTQKFGGLPTLILMPI